MQHEYGPKSYRRIEMVFFVLAVFVFIIISAKYFSSPSGGSILTHAKDAILKKMNAYYLEKSSNDIVSQQSLILKISDDGRWRIFNVDGSESDLYSVENLDGKILIYGLKKGVAQDLYVDGVRSYFTRSEMVSTDIPHDVINGDSFLVPEQEDLFPIFGYHNIFDREEDIRDPYLDIRKSDFEGQVQVYNHEINCRWATLREVVENFILVNKKLPRNVCVMTFDDGRKNNYEIAFPILKENGIRATFYIIFGRLGSGIYMTKNEVAELFRAGNEMGSHTMTGGSLVDTSWFAGEFTDNELKNQLQDSKEISEVYSYNSRTFAYPLGDWNDKVVTAIKDAGYIAARDTEKDEQWRDHRALAVSATEDFIWHLNYYKPELRFDDEIYQNMRYSGWWQFEEGNLVSGDENGNVLIKHDVDIPNQGYGVVVLVDPNDSNRNAFLLEQNGQYVIDMLLAKDQSKNIDPSVFIDGINQPIQKDDSQTCTTQGKDVYCHYTIEASLSQGRHTLDIINNSGIMKLDRFRIYRRVLMKQEYELTITKD